jgi:hypothetical protein
MAAHIFGIPVEEFLSASWGAIALTLGVLFAAGGLMLRRGLRHLGTAGGRMRARVGKAVAHERPRQ